MKLTETNCPLLKYLRWEKSLFEHPDFKDVIIPLNSDTGRDLIRQANNGVNLADKGLRVSKIINTSKLGKRGFLRPYTTELSEEFQMSVKKRGGKISDYDDIYIDLEPIDKTQWDNAEVESDGHDNQTDFSDCLIELNKHWGERSVAFREHIDIVSANFWDAMLNSSAAFFKESILSILSGQSLKGTIIVPSQKGKAYLYDFKINKIFHSDTDENDILIDYDGTIVHLHDYAKTKVFVTPECQFVDQSYLIEGEPKSKVLNEALMSIILYELFKRYAEVEVKLAKQCKQHRENLEVNTFTPDVNYIDCSWFTTIIRTEGFKVRGHFRLQPCGTGRKDHKLIYINEFEKHGYVRRAKIEKQS